MPELQYEPHVQARPVVTECDGDCVRVIVLSTRRYPGVPSWSLNLSELSLFAAPLAWIGVRLLHLVRPKPLPPRATFEIRPDRFSIILREESTEQPRKIECARSALAEIRHNRYENGLWLDIRGQLKDTILADVSKDTIAKLETELHAALVLIPPGST